MTANRIFRKLDAQLRAQAECLRAGRLNEALALAPRIETLVEQLQTTKVTDAVLVEALRAHGDRNARLIEAARQGVKDARRMLEPAVAQTGFQTYDAQGRSSRIGDAG